MSFIVNLKIGNYPLNIQLKYDYLYFLEVKLWFIYCEYVIYYWICIETISLGLELYWTRGIIGSKVVLILLNVGVVTLIWQNSQLDAFWVPIHFIYPLVYLFLRKHYPIHTEAETSWQYVSMWQSLGPGAQEHHVSNQDVIPYNTDAWTGLHANVYIGVDDK